jgi:hypothetical protein
MRAKDRAFVIPFTAGNSARCNRGPLNTILDVSRGKAPLHVSA